MLSLSQFIKDRVGININSLDEGGNGRVLLDFIENQGAQALCKHIYEAVVRLSEGELISRIFAPDQMDVLYRAAISAEDLQGESKISNELEKVAFTIGYYSDFLKASCCIGKPYREEGQSTYFDRNANFFRDNFDIQPPHSLFNHRGVLVEILSELNSEELSRFYSRHPFFKNLIYPVDVNFNQTRNEFGQLKYVAKTLFYGGRNGVLQLGRLINSDTYVVVKEGYHRVHVWRVPYPQSSVVNQVLNKNFRTIAYLHAIAMRMNNWRRNPLYTEGNKSPVVTVTELGLSNLDPIIDGLNIVKWVFAAGRGALDSRRLQFIKRLADERYRVFDDNEDVSINMRPKVKSFLEEIQGFSNPVTLYRYMNELGRLVFSCATSLQQINVVHQDIKPGNIIVVNNEGFTELKLIDIDHMVHKNDCKYRYKESNVHASGYIDPQVLRFENNFESRLSNDIYATGITLRQLSGQSLSNIYRRGSQPEVNMFHLDEIGKSSDWYPLDYPSMEKVLSRAKGDAPITHLFYVGLLLSSKLATNSSGNVVQSRMEGVRFVVDNSGYFTQGRGMDDPELLDMTLALLKTSCAMNKDLRYQMYNSAAREYGISVNERSFSQYLFNMEKSRVKKLGLESLNRHQIRAIEAPLAWPVDRMLGSESLVSGSSSELRCSSGSSVGTYA